MAEELANHTKILEESFLNVQEIPTIQQVIQRFQNYNHISKFDKYKNDALHQEQIHQNSNIELQKKTDRYEKSLSELDLAIQQKQSDQKQLQSEIEKLEAQKNQINEQLSKQKLTMELFNEISGKNKNNQDFQQALEQIRDHQLNLLFESNNIQTTTKDIQILTERESELNLILDQLRNKSQELDTQIYDLEYNSVGILKKLLDQQKIEDEILSVLQNNNSIIDTTLTTQQNIEKFTSKLIEQCDKLSDQKQQLIIEVNEIKKKKKENEDKENEVSKELDIQKRKLKISIDNVLYVQHLKDSYSTKINQMGFEVQLNHEKNESYNQKISALAIQRDQLLLQFQQPIQIIASDLNLKAMIGIILAFVALNFMVKMMGS